jgi:hypothetical protein
MDILGTLTAIKTATEIAKGIRDAKNSLDQAETQFKMAEIIGALADAKTNFADIKNELVDKDNEIRKLKDKLTIKDKMSFDGSKYWLKNDDFPYCKQCYESTGKLLHLELSERRKVSAGNVKRVPVYQCTECKNSTLNTSKPKSKA